LIYHLSVSFKHEKLTSAVENIFIIANSISQMGYEELQLLDCPH